MFSQDKFKDERQEKQYCDFGIGQDIRNDLRWAGGSKGLEGVSKELWTWLLVVAKKIGLVNSKSFLIFSLWGPGSLDIWFKEPQASDATPGWKSETPFIVLWADSTQGGIAHGPKNVQECSQSITSIWCSSVFV